jgi:hypothetical protein
MTGEKEMSLLFDAHIVMTNSPLGASGSARSLSFALYTLQHLSIGLVMMGHGYMSFYISPDCTYPPELRTDFNGDAIAMICDVYMDLFCIGAGKYGLIYC